ncbi:MAG: hypothetical protein COT85_04625 [Chlamydiae bacterium CG10_big_fil_rev_8_21_14_0_10_42_34]|nr:MAG: hypothetical protein COT85_04625 [Chlamydiae bacterium CG10_big_fil_rev_8_21_14_0_10_42_34]
MNTYVWFLLLTPFLLFSQSPQDNPTPGQIEVQLQDAEAEFQRALKLFSPWYTGPLITPGASMMPPGNGNTQPYLFVIDNYAAFNKDRKSIALENNLIQLKGTANVQTGITDNFDINVSFSGISNWQNGHHGGGFGDIGVTGGFLINKQTLYAPAVKLTISETFPTGSYKSLNNNGLNLSATGAGAYSTQFGLGFSKVILWATEHPMNVRCFFGYQLSTVVNVKGFHAYGGGFGCNGKVKPGNTFSADFGYEYSFNENWVAALDVVYSATNRTKFHGNAGLTASGTPASSGSGYSDNLSFAPAIEYNWSPKLGLIAGGWFSVYGRNSSKYAAGIISLTISYP